MSQRTSMGEGWSLREGSCLDPEFGLASLPDKSIAHVITDPPYEDEAHTKQKRVRWIGQAVDSALPFAPMTEAERSAVAVEWARVCRGWVVLFCQVEAVAAWRDALVSAGLKYRRALPWVKPDAMPCLHGRWPGQAFETIILASAAKGAPRCAGHGKAAWYLYTRIPAGPGRGGPCPHPTAKPLPLMRELVELVSKPGDLIVDPYAGSGTTGVACKTLGRRFIGWELDSGYAEVARRRLSGEEAKPSEAQPSLF